MLLAGWCGLRFGEVSELRRKDFDRDCAAVTITRTVTHRIDPDNPGERCPIKDGTKNGEQLTVTIPPHIREDELADFYGQLLGMRTLFESPDGRVVAISDGVQCLTMMRVDDHVPPSWPERSQR